MSRSTNLFAGIFGSFAVSCIAMILIPNAQVGSVHELVNADEGTRYPVVNTRQGEVVYKSEGCYYCHTQQLRDAQNGSDIERGWGNRRTVARDYIYVQTPMLGSTRLGPDLTNVGTKEWRNEPVGDYLSKPAKRDRAWHLLHLYNPTAIYPNSKMPPYRYLFEEVKRGTAAAANAIPVKASKEGYVVVPTSRANELVDYLLSLDRTAPLPEAGVIKAAPAEKK